MQRTIGSLVFIVSAVLTPVAAASEQEILLPSFAGVELEPVQSADDDEPFDLTDTMDEQHTELSEQVVHVGRRLDRFFGGDQYVRETKTSELRLGLTTKFTHDDIDLDTRVRFRLALPRTERRLSVILESAEDNLISSASDDTIQQTERRPNDEDDGYFAGLRYVRRLADVWGIDTDAGVKLRLPPDPYLRVRVNRSWFMELLEARLSQSLFWRRSEGQGATSELLLQRALEGPQFLQSVTQATWLDRYERYYYSQDLTVSHEFSELHAVQLRLGLRAESKPDTHVTAYFLNLPWRRNIFRKWLFLEVRPELLFEQETDFDVQPRLFFTLEAYFGDRHVTARPAPPLVEPLLEPLTEP